MDPLIQRSAEISWIHCCSSVLGPHAQPVLCSPLTSHPGFSVTHKSKDHVVQNGAGRMLRVSEQSQTTPRKCIFTLKGLYYKSPVPLFTPGSGAIPSARRAEHLLPLEILWHGMIHVSASPGWPHNAGFHKHQQLHHRVSSAEP